MNLINGKIYTMEDGIIEKGFVTIEKGKITAVAEMTTFNGDLTNDTVDLKGSLVFPGFVDAHTHLGMWEDGLGFEGDDGNEATDPSTPHLRSIDAINPTDRCFQEAAQSGITTVISGPGSANPLSGQMLAMKTHGKRIDDMLIQEPVAVKMALGENPKTIYHGKNQTPETRMATAAIIREQLHKANKYMVDLIDADKDDPEYDIKCEALIPLLKGEVKAHIHAHRADDIFTAIRICKEFKLDYVIVHGTEGHLIADLLKKEDASVIIGPVLCDRSKPELGNLTPKNGAVLFENGVDFALCSDHPVVPVQYLPLCAGILVREGLPYEQAIRAITINPARICGIDKKVGSIKVGKDADLAVFRDDPLSVYSKPDMVFIGGVQVK